MPILVRPVREQLEHDRVIRQLQTRCRRRYDVVVNIGEDQANLLRVGSTVVYPDLVLTAQQRGRRVEAVVEVETGESVNHLEALAQWAHMARTRAPLHLYVPASSVEAARRLCSEHQIGVAEIWSYHFVGDQTRFTMVHRLKAPVARSAARSSSRTRTAGKSKSRKTAGRTPSRVRASGAPRGRAAGTTARPAAKSTKKGKASLPRKGK